MENLDWKMISVAFSIFHFVFMAIVFAIIKFNDLAHLDKKVEAISTQQKDFEAKENTKHLENVSAINKLAVAVGTLSGRCNAVQEITKELNK